MRIIYFYFITSISVAWSEESFNLVKVYPQSQKHIEELNKLAQSAYIDVWHASAERYDLFVPESFLSTLHSFLSSTQCSSILSDIDVTKEVQEEAKRLKARAPQFDYNNFNDLRAIETEIERLAAKCIPGFVCKIESIGSSAEKRFLKKLVISKAGQKRKVQWLDATTHAREWLSTATLMKILQHFYNNYNETTVKHLLDTYDWHFLPVVNPDGYVYSWASPAIKNHISFTPDLDAFLLIKAINTNPECPEVDLLRNSDEAWGTEGASRDECSEIYMGPSAASEPETRALQEQLQSLDLIQYISVHSYGSCWLTPYAQVDQKTKKCLIASDEEEMKKVADAAANAMEKVYNTTWLRGDACVVKYPVSGTPMDFAKRKAGVKYACVFEVRGEGFIVPPSQIEPSFREMWEGLKAAVKAIEEA